MYVEFLRLLYTPIHLPEPILANDGELMHGLPSVPNLTSIGIVSQMVGEKSKFDELSNKTFYNYSHLETK